MVSLMGIIQEAFVLTKLMEREHSLENLQHKTALALLHFPKIL